MRLILVVLVFHFLLAVALGQDPPADTRDDKTRRPKVGLVLSGGGARGFAHIGVLRALEEKRIPVDFVSGASMGALVGALYSIGKTPDEMKQLVEQLDWGKLLSGSPSYKELSYRRKQDRRNIPGALTLGGQNPRDLKLPGSINPGHKIGLAIDNIFFSYSSVEDFDDLPVPFRAVATDMLNADTVVLKSGSIQQSLRATMAIPAVFAPVEIDGKVLADGGILNNIPTRAVKDMGADIILVVNIETQIGDRSSLENLIGVLGQTFIVSTVENSRRSLRDADFIIAPDLKDYSSSDFTKGNEIIELGYNGAKQKVALLDALSLSESDWQTHLALRRGRQLEENNQVMDYLSVDGADTSREKEILREGLREKHVSSPVNKTELEKDLTALTGTKRFDSLGYELTRANDSEGLMIRVYDSQERTDNKAFLDIGVEVNNTESDATNFNTRGRLTIFDIGGYGTEWRNDFSIGSRTLFATEFFRPIGEGRFFVAPNALYQNRKVGFFQNETRIAEYSFKTAKVGVDLGYSINSDAEVRIGIQIGNQNISRRIGDPLLPELNGRFTAASLDFNYDGADNAQIPTRGLRISSSLNYFFEAPGAESGFPQAELTINSVHPFTDRYRLFGFGAGGTSFGNTAPQLQQFTIGGLFNVGGYGREEFRASNFGRAGLGFLRETYSLPTFIGGKVYFGGWYEVGSAFEDLKSANFRHSLTGGALLETPIGPMFVGGSVTEDGRRKLYFSLGRFF